MHPLKLPILRMDAILYYKWITGPLGALIFSPNPLLVFCLDDFAGESLSFAIREVK